MEILVLVKDVPDATGERGFADDHTVDREATDGLLSELDEYAVEQALRVADDGDDVEVVVLTVGPDDASAAIKRALQMGASAASTSSTTRSPAPTRSATSEILAAAIRKEAPDLVLCGMASTDGAMGVGAGDGGRAARLAGGHAGRHLEVAGDVVTRATGDRHRESDHRGPNCPPWSASPTSPARRGTRR